MESKKGRGLPFRSIILHSLWTTLTGILFFSLATMNAHNLFYIKLFAISGTLLVTLPWIIQLLVTSAVILLLKTKSCDLMWIIRSSSKENDPKVGSSSSSSSLSSSQVLKEGDADEIKIRIVIGADGNPRAENGSSAAPLGMLMEIEGRNNAKLLTNGSS